MNDKGILQNLQQEVFDYLVSASDWINQWTAERVTEMDFYELLRALGYDSVDQYMRDQE